MSDLVDALGAGFSGELLVPGQPAYDERRSVFNAMFDRRPAVIAHCATTADVVAAVDLARERGLVVAVRCGGHSVAGLGTCDDGVLIDLSGLKSMSVDPEARVARAGGGVLWGEFDAATQEHGLHAPGGRVTTTGLGGFTTGGGYGWTSSKYGLACDNLLSVELVLADGSVVRASEDENPELFWGVRGGGGNFGVVTEFEFRLHPLGPIVLAGMMLFEIERAPEVLRGWRDWADAAPDEISTGCVLLTAPPEPFVPTALHGRPVVAIPALYVGDADRGSAAIAPLRALSPAVDHVGPMPYTAFQSMLDEAAPRGFRSYWRGDYMRELADAALDTFVSGGVDLLTLAPPLSQMVIFRVGQGVAATPDAATAFSHRDARYLFHPITMWTDAHDDERMIAASRAYATEMHEFATGASYLNFEPDADRVRAAYGEEKYRRLVALKDAYDPANVFRLNQNVRPSRPAAEPALA